MCVGIVDVNGKDNRKCLFYVICIKIIKNRRFECAQDNHQEKHHFMIKSGGGG